MTFKTEMAEYAYGVLGDRRHIVTEGDNAMVNQLDCLTLPQTSDIK